MLSELSEMTEAEARTHLRECGVGMLEAPLRRGAAVGLAEPLGEGTYLGHSPAGVAWIAWRLPSEPEAEYLCRVDEMSLALDGLWDAARRRDQARRSSLV